jgi:hypothetical protein
MNTICLLKESAAWALCNILRFIWNFIPRAILNILASLAIVGAIVGILAGIAWLIAPGMLAMDASIPLFIRILMMIGAFVSILYICMSIAISINKTALDLYDQKPSAWFYITYFQTMRKLAAFVVLLLPIFMAPLIAVYALFFMYYKSLTVPMWWYIALVAAYATLIVCSTILMRIQFASLSIVDRPTTGVWAAIRGSWGATSCAPWFFIAEALLVVLVITYQATTSTQQVIAALAGTPFPQPAFTICTGLVWLLTMLFSFWINLFVVGLYRKFSGCCTGAAQDSCCK